MTKFSIGMRCAQAVASAFVRRPIAIAGLVAGTFYLALRADTEPLQKPIRLERGQIARTQHEAQVWSLAFSPDETRLASTTILGEVAVEHLTNDHLVHLRGGSFGSVRAVAFNPDGRVLAYAGGEPAVKFWDLTTGTLLPALEVGGEWAHSLAFDREGSLLAVGEQRGHEGRGRVTIWDWRKHQQLAALDGLRGGIHAVAFSPDGSHLAVGDAAGELNVWSVPGWKHEWRVQAHATGFGGLLALAFSPSGDFLATAGSLDRTVRLWCADTGRSAGEVTATACANALTFSPDGEFIAIALGDGQVALWNQASRRLSVPPQTPSLGLYALAFSPSGEMLATGSMDGTVNVWDAKVLLSHDRP